MFRTFETCRVSKSDEAATTEIVVQLPQQFWMIYFGRRQYKVIPSKCLFDAKVKFLDSFEVTSRFGLEIVTRVKFDFMFKGIRGCMVVRRN